MKQDWSTKKRLLFTFGILGALVVLIILQDIFDWNLRDNIYSNRVLFIIFCLVLLSFIVWFLWLVVVAFPKAIFGDMKKRRALRNAKWAAYDIIDRFGVIHLKKDFDHDKIAELKQSNKIDEIMEMLSHKRDDIEARHLLYDLSELERGLKQTHNGEDEQLVPGKKEKEDPFANQSNEDLLAMKAKYPGNKSVAKIVDEVLEARARKTNKS